MSTLGIEDLMHVGARVFGARESTLEEEASDMSIEDLKSTVRAIRRMFNAAAAGLPESAYERQPDDADGNDVWSAGEIVGHITAMTLWTEANIHKLTGQQEIPPPSEAAAFAEVKVRSKGETLRALDAAESALTRMLDAISEDVDTRRTIEDDTFGSVGVKGWLLLTALHEGDHTGQLRELAY